MGLATLALLHWLGRLGLPLGRLVGAHINALRTVTCYGTQGQMMAVADAVLNGELFGLWVIDAPMVAALRMHAAGDAFRFMDGKSSAPAGRGSIRPL